MGFHLNLHDMTGFLTGATFWSSLLAGFGLGALMLVVLAL